MAEFANAVQAGIGLPVEHFLADCHDRAPGGSTRAFAGLQVQANDGCVYPSSYHALLSALLSALQATLQAAALPPGPVLDLACGDGHLLQLLRATGRPLLGVDLSAGELAAARTRLGDASKLWGDSVLLHQARAQALPLADASVAAITCHMALMLMAEPAAVVTELRRVLKPGGRLLAVVPATPGNAQQPGRADSLTLAWLAALAGLARQPRWHAVQFENRRWRDPATQAALLQPGFRALRFTRLSTCQHLTPAQATAWFTGMYDLHLLSVDDRGAVEADFHARLAPLLDANGRASLPFATTLIDATAAP